MKFLDAEEGKAGCSADRCTKRHMGCCHSCQELSDCSQVCEVYHLQTKQPFPLIIRSCRNLVESHKLVWESLLGRETIL